MTMESNRPIKSAVIAVCTTLPVLSANAFDPLNPIPDPIEKGSITIELEQIATGVVSPNYLTGSGDGSVLLFVVQQPGQIGIIENGTRLPTPFLDVSDRMPALGCLD